VIREIVKYFDQHKTLGTLISYLLVIIIGILDIMTGYILGFSIFYLLPIVNVAWILGTAHGILISIVCTLVWLFADIAAGHADQGLFVIAWNAGVRLGFFVTVSVILAKLKDSLEREKMLARKDFLTGISNNQAFMEFVTEETRRSRRYPRPMTIVYIDCDHFKIVNDTYGHETGNRLLREVALTIQKSIRATDRAGRLGGDEFVILLPETDSEGSQNVIRRMKDGLTRMMQQNNWDVTFSIGVATFNTALESASEMIIQADRLMYAAKKEGKNRAVFQTFEDKKSQAT